MTSRINMAKMAKRILIISTMLVSSVALQAATPIPMGPLHKKAKKTPIAIPHYSEIDERTLGNLIDELVTRGILDPNEAEMAKQRVEDISEEQWNRIRSLARATSRNLASQKVRGIKGGSSAGVAGVGGNGIKDIKDEEARQKNSMDEFDAEKYKKLSREVEGVLGDR